MTITLLSGDARDMLQTLPDQSVQCVITSPPYYGLRSYGSDPREIGREATPAAYVAALVEVFRAVRRVLRDDGVCWVNLGDCFSAGKSGRDDEGPADIARRAAAYHMGAPKALSKGANGVARTTAGIPPKNLLGIPWRVAFALQDAGWILRSDVIWSKPNPMPESVTDRPTRAHEYVFLLSKSARYFYDAAAIAEQSTTPPHAPGNKADNGRLTSSMGHVEQPDRVWAASGTRNRRSVWTIATQPYSGAGDCESCDGTGVDWTAMQVVWGMPMSDAQHKAFCQAHPCPTCDGSGKDGTDHFATMPEALIEPCILAGSASQACETCGAAWGRVVEREKGANESRDRHKRTAGMESSTSTLSLSGNHGAGWKKNGSKVHDLGFAPRCACATNTGSARSIVLDPFGGSGTVARVAERFHRDSIMIDLNAEYIELQEQRTDGVQTELFR